MPPGTVRVIGSDNGVAGVAYDVNGNALGIVQARLRKGATVFYSGGQTPTPTAIRGVGMKQPDKTFWGNPLPKSAPPGGYPPPKPQQFNGYAPDSIYNDALGTIASNRRQVLDAATEGERGLAGDYGLGIAWKVKLADGTVVDRDPSNYDLPAGAVDLGASMSGPWAASDANRGGIDPSNPFSRASLLNKSYFAANRVGEGSYANRGLLTSGAYQRSQQRDAFNFESGRDQLLRQFASGLQGYRDRRAQAESEARTQGINARGELFNRNRDLYDRTYPV